MSNSTPELIPILRVASATAAVGWYVKLGFKQDWEHRFEDNLPAFVQISNGGTKIFLSEHTGDASPDTLVFLRVADVDAFIAGFADDGVVAEDSEVIGMRDVELKDPDGNRVRIGSSLRASE